MVGFSLSSRLLPPLCFLPMGAWLDFFGFSPQVAYLSFLTTTQKVFICDLRDIADGSLSLGTPGEQPADSLHQYIQNLPASGLQVRHELCHH